MSFGPRDANEAVIFALEGLRSDFQYEVLKALKTQSLTQADLARRLGVAPAWVSQILSDDANVTLESIAKVFAALGVNCSFSSSSANASGVSVAPAVSKPQGAWTEEAIITDAKVRVDAYQEPETVGYMRCVARVSYGRRKSLFENRIGQSMTGRASAA